MKYLQLLLLLCLAGAANAQKHKPADSVKIKKQLRADSIKYANQVYTNPDIMPNFPGGDGALKLYIDENMQYPTRDREDNTQGKVFVRFVVERDGSISHVKAVVTPSATMAMEAERLAKAMPKWKPGVVGDKTVRVQFTIAVNFSLQP